MKFSILLPLIFGICTSGIAQNLSERKLLPNDGSAGDTFGFAVAISGETALVGANEKNDFKGAAYFFQKDDAGWQQHAALLPADVAPAALYGFSVALDGDIAVVGARNDDDNGVNAGAIYIYERRNGVWQQAAKIISDDGRSFDFFGNTVAISAETIIVGAPGDDVHSGAAYIVVRQAGAWRLQTKLTAGDRAFEDLFGTSVAIAGDYALVGASSDDDRGLQSGAAYIFERQDSVWVQKAKLLPADGVQEDLFGVSVDLTEDYALIGAIGNDEKSPGAGAAYVYKRNPQSGVWQMHKKLLASDGKAQDQFGNAVAISGDYAVVGALMQFSGGNGAAYLFRREGDDWIEQNIFTASDAATNDRFGNAVDVAGDVAIVGARYDDDNGRNSGAAYVYSGFATTVGIGTEENAPLAQFELQQNYPNPFNPSTVIDYHLAMNSEVDFSIYTVQGQLVRTLAVGERRAGSHSVAWDASDDSGQRVASGIYFARLQAGAFVQTRKMLLLK